MSRLRPAARRLLLVPIAGAAYGWQDLLRGLPGRRVGLVLPLREPSHGAAVPLAGLLAVWLVAFAIAALVVPVRVLPRWAAALLRGAATFGLVALLQAVSLELVRQATLGFAWGAALAGAAPWIAGACAAVATVAATPRRRRLAAPAGAALEAASSKRDRLRRASVLLALVLLAAGGASAQARPSLATRTWQISYRAWDGHARRAFVVLPAWYGPRDHPAIPLVISPHGRGVEARDNVHFWGDLPAAGRFAVVNPEGQGRRLTLYSWGDPGAIADLARMPSIVRHALPWLRIAAHRIYAIGGSMGGQETLLLVARDPHLLAGAISFDANTDMVLRYRDFALVPAERHLQRLARLEIGGTPGSDLAAFRRRSPIDQARAIAASGVPLELWWSTRDRVVIDQSRNSEALFDRLVALGPRAPVTGVVGTWKHTAEMWYFRRLPTALASLGLLPAADAHPFPRLIRSDEASPTRWSAGRARTAGTIARSIRACPRTSIPPCRSALPARTSLRTSGCA